MREKKTPERFNLKTKEKKLDAIVDDFRAPLLNYVMDVPERALAPEPGEDTRSIKSAFEAIKSELKGISQEDLVKVAAVYLYKYQDPQLVAPGNLAVAIEAFKALENDEEKEKVFNAYTKVAMKKLRALHQEMQKPATQEQLKNWAEFQASEVRRDLEFYLQVPTE